MGEFSSNTVGRLAKQQVSANMQKVMRGYGSGLEKNFDGDVNEGNQIVSIFLKHIMKYGFIIRDPYSLSKDVPNFTEFALSHSEFEKLSEILKNTNNEFLDDPNFGKRTMIKWLGSFSGNRLILYTFKKISIDTNLFYLAGITNNEPNIVRLGIMYDDVANTNDVINGYIDFCSDGKIVTDFKNVSYRKKYDTNGHAIQDKKGNIIYEVEKEVAVDIKDTLIDIAKVQEIKEYIMHIFELAELKTEKQNIK